MLPQEATARLLDLPASASWKANKNDVVTVCKKGGVLGKRLFSFALAEVVESIVEEKIQAAIQTLLDSEKIDESRVRTVSVDTTKDLEQLQDLDALPARRLVHFNYRGMSVATKVGCMSEQVTAALVAAYKGYAVEAGDLIPLPGENEMCKPTGTYKAGVVSPSLLNHSNTARRWAATVLKASDCANAETMKVGWLSKTRTSCLNKTTMASLCLGWWENSEVFKNSKTSLDEKFSMIFMLMQKKNKKE